MTGPTSASSTADLDFVPDLGDFDLSTARLAAAFKWPMVERFRVALGTRLDYVIDPPGGRDELDVLVTLGVTYEM